MSTKDTPLFIIENKILKGQKLSPPDDGKCLGEILLENLKKNPDFVGQIDALTGKTCTHRKLANDSIRCALWLKKQGIVSGDIVSICSPNNIASWAPFCAVFYIGGNLNPWYHDWSPETARYFLNLTKPKIIFANEKSGTMLKEVIREENINTKIIIFGKVPGLESFGDIIQQQSSEEVEQFQCRIVDPNDDGLVLFSSGSSGLPKAVQHSYQGIYYNSYKWNAAFKETNRGVMMFTSSMYWITGALSIFQNILTMSTAIIISDPSSEELCEAIEKYQVQWMFVGTGTINDLSTSEVLTKFNLSSLKTFVTGGSKIRPEAIHKINRDLKNCQILMAYGSTELGGIGIVQVKKKDQNYESTGIVFFDVEIKFVDTHTGKILNQAQRGELFIKQKYMMKGYIKNAKATAEVIDADGWLHSGDLGYYDKDGNIYIVERIKEVIKYRGHHISPAEIENILVKHPKVLDAVVLPVPHSIDDEHPIAFVLKEKNSEVSENELLQLTSVLGETKKLRGGIVFLEKFPLNPSMKIDKLILKEMAKTYAS